jgi:hypothetical protein
MAALRCPCEQEHKIWGEVWWLEVGTSGCSSTIWKVAKPVANSSRTALGAVGSSRRLRNDQSQLDNRSTIGPE